MSKVMRPRLAGSASRYSFGWAPPVASCLPGKRGRASAHTSGPIRQCSQNEKGPLVRAPCCLNHANGFQSNVNENSRVIVAETGLPSFVAG